MRATPGGFSGARVRVRRWIDVAKDDTIEAAGLE
jgi:hypothetical protein